MPLKDSQPTLRVGVAMSGGVDSSTAAWMLHAAGHAVSGFTMALTGAANDERAITSARGVCQFLGIPHEVVDLRAEFRRHVMDYFCDTYFEGLTPNPCVYCNKHVKFGLLLDHVLASGNDAMATGHYVIRSPDPARGHWVLRKGGDPRKDQSYFLYRLSADALARTLFPNGEYTKPEIKALARGAGLPVAEAPESQEVCFVPRDYGAFVAAQRPGRATQGQIVDTGGKLLGWHEGIHLYTVGQRRGLGVSAPEPLYVLRIEPETNRVVVAPDAALLRDKLVTKNNHFVSGAPPEHGARVHAKIRYNAQAVPATLHHAGQDALHVLFDASQRAVTPGQSAVFYHGDIVLGGGIIQIETQE